MYKFWILALTLSGLTQWASGQNSPASVPQPVVAAKVGSPANLTCLSHKLPLNMCLWEKKVTPGQQRALISISKGKDIDGQATAVEGFTYRGSGLDKGECGIQINTVQENDNDVWSCTLFAESGAILVGTVDVTILRKPNPPRFDSTLGRLNDGDEKTITCYSESGQPPPTFQWFIDDTPITNPDELSRVDNKTNGQQVATYQTLKRKFSWKDSGKKLRCLTVSAALSPNDLNEVSEAINVDYAPHAAQEKVHQQVSDRGVPATISFNVSASPAPRISWTIDNVQVNEGFKTVDQRMEAKRPRQVAPELYQVDLVISNVEEADLGKTYKLTATNQFGARNFEIHVSSNAEPTGGLSAGGIVGLVLGIPVILILIALVVVYARAKGLLCFKGDDGTSSEKERMGEDGDSNKGPTEEKPTISSRLSALYENLLAKKKDKTAPIDEEANKVGQDKDKEQQAATEEKKPDDIVYAELDLARGGVEGGVQPVVVRGSDDKTEYAEIVGVVPPAQVKEEKEKKSPGGSKNSSPKK